MSENEQLFNPRTIKRLITQVKEPIYLQKHSSKEWLKLLLKGELKEKSNYFRFAPIILKEILGYDILNFNFEEKNMEFFFKDKQEKPLVVFEVKGTKTKDFWADQHRPSEDKKTPVKQIWNYMLLHEIPYGVLTNYNKFILFDRSKSPKKYYEINFEDIKQKPEKLKEFIAIFSKKSIESKFIEKLKKESSQEDRIFTKEFYKLFHETRLMLIKEFEINIDKDKAIHYTQLFLNRLMFIFFAEDTGKLPKRTFEKRIIDALGKREEDIYENSYEICESIKKLFRMLNTGNSKLNIPYYNGGLFEEELPLEIKFKDYRKKEYFKELEQKSSLKKEKNRLLEEYTELRELIIKHEQKLNPITINLIHMASYDFKTEVNVNILGHIFEQSLSDLENIQENKVSKRKKDGIYYTPEYITDYICRNTIIPYISKTEDNTHIPTLINDYKDNINKLEEKIEKLRIVDPACGSGAFLIKAVDVLLEVYKDIEEFKNNKGEYLATKIKVKRKKERKGEEIKGQSKITKFNAEDRAREIIENCIYGVDLNEESVEITKLSLFLKIARRGKKLPKIDNKIMCGNSLIDDPEVAGDKAFSWEKEFPDIFEGDNPGFDIVIGNPPYVDNSKINDLHKKYFNKKYIAITSHYDIYIVFYELGIKLLNAKGILAYITSNKWFSQSYGLKLRKLLLQNKIIKIIDFNNNDIFEDATVETQITIVRKEDSKNKDYNLLSYYYYNSEITLDKILYTKINTKLFKLSNEFNFKLLFTSKDINILNKIVFYNKKINLEQICYVTLGTVIHCKNSENTKKEFLYNVYLPKYKPYSEGKDILKWYVKKPTKYLDYSPDKHREPRFKELFENKKIVCIRTSTKRNPHRFSLDFKNYFADSAIIAIKYELIPSKYNNIHKSYSIDYNYILSLLNSELYLWYFEKLFSDGLHFYPRHLKNMPIPNIDEKKQKPFIEKTNLMINLNKEYFNKIDNFLELLRSNYDIKKESNKLKEFYKYDFKDLLNELKKQKIDVKMTNQHDLLDTFNKYKLEILSLKEQISTTDDAINQVVYKLYELTDEEIKIVEDNT